MNQNSIFFLLPDTLAVRLLSASFTFRFCKLQFSYLQIYFKSIRLTKHANLIIEGCCELMC